MQIVAYMTIYLSFFCVDCLVGLLLGREAGCGGHCVGGGVSKYLALKVGSELAFVISRSETLIWIVLTLIAIIIYTHSRVIV